MNAEHITKAVGRKRTESKDREVMLQRCNVKSVTVKGDGRMKGSGEKVEEGHTTDGQNRVGITVQGSAHKQRMSTKETRFGPS